MKKLRKHWFLLFFFLAFIVVLLNLKASKRLYFGYFLLEHPASSRWEAVLERLNSKEREKYFACCVDKKIRERLRVAEKEEREKIKKLEDALKLNPYNWQVMLELVRLYKRQGEENKARELEARLKSLFPSFEKVKSFVQ